VKLLISIMMISLTAIAAHADKTIVACESEQYKAQITQAENEYTAIVFEKNEAAVWVVAYKSLVQPTTTRGSNLLFTNDYFGLSVNTELTSEDGTHIGVLRMWSQESTLDVELVCRI
jgi:phenylpyruvate tautomerase PptA (4-oxalocrotonate tautomerase family)